MRKFGLIGYPLTHSFSRKYFSEKFEKEHIENCSYELFEIKDIENFPELISKEPLLSGLNVTIPHKKNVISFLDSLDHSAENVGAVNVIKFVGGKLVGYNSDYYGFMMSLREFIGKDTRDLKALILGTGGASSAVQASLKTLNIPFIAVSRNSSENTISYEELLNASYVESHKLIINTTPLGMYPKIETLPPIPYEKITSQHFLFDLVYNPRETTFLKMGKSKGAKTLDGLEMLHFQAEKAWEIWNASETIR
ncbi:MAG TPA: shikimate dehydrogenase [Cytophagales bacterium]|nr:shikimate dehydrogenase [Cytophagales bacterium]